MTVNEAIKRAVENSKRKLSELKRVRQTKEYYIVSFINPDEKDGSNLPYAPGGVPNSFLVSKQSGTVEPFYLPNERNFEILKKAREVEL